MQTIRAAGKSLASAGHAALFNRLNCFPGLCLLSFTSQFITYLASFPTRGNFGTGPECWDNQYIVLLTTHVCCSGIAVARSV
jgi:hypothetical protein